MTKKETRSSEFIALADEEKLKLLRMDGVYVGKIKKEEQTIILFQLYSFYVEVHYKQYRRNVSQIVVSENINTLQPYLDQVRIKDINKGDEKS